ncbi:MAG: AAA family ATPase [Magnetococcales bacterium]|nr:AAA family ATPase [Magnetococcales bacterium]NGZ07696.1 AAA family ATPase [Magnetococcales bacterium]
MYLDHFGFHAHPFAITPDTGLFFSGGARGDILEQLLQAVAAGEGFIQVVGEVGSGKTMLCRLLCRRLPPTTHVALLLNPALPPEELIGAVLQEFRIPWPAESGQTARHQALLEFLVSLEQRGERAVILIEEAQGLTPATLEALRLISNLETEQRKLVSILLFGQPGLERLLRRAECRQILERITTRLTLPALTLHETGLYLNNRVHLSGYRGPQLFAPVVVRRIHRASRGSVRQINLLAEKALIQATRHGAHVITSRHVRPAFLTLGRIPGMVQKYIPGLAAAGLLVFLAGTLSWHGGTWNEMPWKTLPASPVATENLPVPDVLAAVPPTEEPKNLSQQSADSQTRLTLSRTLSPILPRTPTGPQPQNATMLASLTVTSLPARAARTDLIKPLKPTVREVATLPVNTVADPMEERVRAAHRWLESSQGTRYTIQLIHLRQDKGIQQLDRALTMAQPDLHARKLKVFRLRNQKWMVYLGEFDSEQEAQEAILRLPQELRAGNPRALPIDRVKTLVRDHIRPNGCQNGQEKGACTPSA